MLRLKILLFVLAFFSTNVEMYDLGKYNFTSGWYYSMKDAAAPPIITKYRDHLVFTTLGDYVIRLESLRFANKPCELTTPMLKERKAKGGLILNNVLPIYTEVLSNNKIFVVLLEAKPKWESNQTNVWLHAVDPQECTYDAINLTLDGPIAYMQDFMAIVPYRDSFDVFVKSDVYCESGSICNLRYSNDLVLLKSFKKLVIPYEDETWDLTLRKDFDPSEGYLYIVRIEKSNSTVFRYLDADFNVSREVLLSHGDSRASWYNDKVSTSTCYRLSDKELECVLFDRRMRIDLAVRLSYDSYLQYYTIFRTAAGEAVVAVITSSDPDGSDPISYVQHIDRQGQVSAPIKFQENLCELIYEMSTIRVKESVFCVITSCLSHVNTKCIGPENERLF